jgi:VWFA-related protein
MRPSTPRHQPSLLPRTGLALAVVVLAVVSVVVAPGAGAQEAATRAQVPGDGPPMFIDTVDVNVVNVEVFVTDRQGRRITGLTKDDFEILQDGEPVEISNFFAIARPNRIDQLRDAEGRRTTTIAPGSDLPAEQQLNLVVYVDHFNLHPQSRKRALEELEGFLEDRMFQGDRVMLVGYDGQLDVVQSFTRDWGLVRDGLRQMGKGKALRVQDDVERRLALRGIRLGFEEDEPEMAFNYVRSYIQEQRLELRRSTEALGKTVRAMAGLPGRRALLYVSDGLPRRPGEDLLEYMRDLFGSQPVATGSNPSAFVDTSIEALNQDEGHLFDEITRHANAQQVTFYTVDARGGTGDSSIGADVDSILLDGAGRNALDALRTTQMQETLIEMAEATGGASILNTFELEDAFYRAGVDFDNFYSLGFQTPSSGDDSYHDVEVRVKDRPGLRVRHRSGFVDKPQSERIADRTLSSLMFEMEANPLGVEVDFGEPERVGRGEFNMPMLVRIPFRGVTLLPNGDVEEGRLRIYLAVKDEKGGVSEMHEYTYPLRIPADQVEAARGKEIGYSATLKIAPGTPRVAIGVWDELSGVESFIHKQVRVEKERRR